MQIEDVTRIRFTSRRTAENQRYLTISYRLLGKVIIHNQRMTACITEILTDGCTRKWRIVLQRGRVTGCSGYYNRIVQRSILTKCIYDRSDCRTFLSDCHIDAVYRVACQKIATLIDDRINRNSRLSRLTVTDNQLTLTTPDRNHGINCLQSGL